MKTTWMNLTPTPSQDLLQRLGIPSPDALGMWTWRQRVKENQGERISQVFVTWNGIDIKVVLQIISPSMIKAQSLRLNFRVKDGFAYQAECLDSENPRALPSPSLDRLSHFLSFMGTPQFEPHP